MHHPGEIAALLTAVFWTITALAFEAASRKIGSMVVNLLRLMAGFYVLPANGSWPDLRCQATAWAR